MREIKQIHIHCSATKTDNISASTIRRWHLQRGWSDIGYHYVIGLDGKIEAGRPVSKIGAHAKGYNKTSIGICYIGGLSENKRAKDTRTEALISYNVTPSFISNGRLTPLATLNHAEALALLATPEWTPEEPNEE